MMSVQPSTFCPTLEGRAVVSTSLLGKKWGHISIGTRLSARENVQNFQKKNNNNNKRYIKALLISYNYGHCSYAFMK